MDNEKTQGGASVVSGPLLDDELGFDLSQLKVELNNVTIMYGPPDVTLRHAEAAMMAYINVLVGDTSNKNMSV